MAGVRIQSPAAKMSKSPPGAYGAKTTDRGRSWGSGVAAAESKSGTAVKSQFSANKRMTITTMLLSGMSVKSGLTRAKLSHGSGERKWQYLWHTS